MGFWGIYPFSTDVGNCSSFLDCKNMLQLYNLLLLVVFRLFLLLLHVKPDDQDCIQYITAMAICIWWCCEAETVHPSTRLDVRRA